MVTWLHYNAVLVVRATYTQNIGPFAKITVSDWISYSSNHKNSTSPISTGLSSTHTHEFFPSTNSVYRVTMYSILSAIALYVCVSTQRYSLVYHNMYLLGTSIVIGSPHSVLTATES